jgi:hypothetical protein
VAALSEYVLQTELPRGWKVPKYAKFAGDTNESTVEHIARYLAESGNLANNENLRLKYSLILLQKMLLLGSQLFPLILWTLGHS